ncbi:serine hydrolase [Paenibacillus sp. J23TS9]|uniref:serine hydrolase domain-containing protein n=1 Tax=Paenibacillus sp. J23TS9 TaxID=2807193 RepID=UPI001B2837BE|nr:serine hydrolase domain-containing protein [Paenibacillus sp. J23TS9]GIP26499.1 serine hydrolase [Paenibacillus sp. J23TS9]
MDFKPLSKFIDRITDWRIPWAEVLVLYQNQEVFRYRSGYADLEGRIPIHDRQIIRLYSLSKILTCTAALQLVDKGELLLNDPLSDYLPEYGEMTVKVTLPSGEVTFEKAKRPIRVRDLFTMSAGLSYDIRSPSILEVVRRTSGRAPTREVAAVIAKEPLLFEPGARWSYSLSHDVLAALVEAVDGRRFGAYVRDEITGPLGMRDTGFDVPDEDRSRLAPQYEYSESLSKPVLKDGNDYMLGSEYESGGAGLFSTVNDYALFLNTLTNQGTSPEGIRILAAETVELMRTDHLSEAMRSHFSWSQLAGYGYGLGVRTHCSKKTSGSLSPLGEFGWSGAAGALAIIDPSSQVTVMYAQHMLNNQEPYVHPRLRNLVYTCL